MSKIINILKFSAFIFISFLLISTVLSTSAQSTLLPKNDVICAKESCPITGGEDTVFKGGATGATNIILQVARLITYISGGLAVLFLVYGGVRYMTADEKGVANARTIIQNAIIGLVIAVVAYSIISIVTGLLSGQFIKGN